MAGIARQVAWGLMGGAATKVARNATRKALHDERGEPRLPRTARTRDDLMLALALAACAGIALAIADVLREQRKITTRGH